MNTPKLTKIYSFYREFNTLRALPNSGDVDALYTELLSR